MILTIRSIFSKDNSSSSSGRKTSVLIKSSLSSRCLDQTKLLVFAAINKSSYRYRLRFRSPAHAAANALCGSYIWSQWCRYNAGQLTHSCSRNLGKYSVQCFCIVHTFIYTDIFFFCVNCIISVYTMKQPAKSFKYFFIYILPCISF